MADQEFARGVDPARAAPVTIIPTKRRLDAPHSVVDMRNNDPQQTHIILSRHMQGIELKPGQTKTGIEMLDSDIEHFQKLGNRTFSRNGNVVRGHPVQIMGTRSQDEENVRLHAEEEHLNRLARGEEDQRPLHERMGRRAPRPVLREGDEDGHRDEDGGDQSGSQQPQRARQPQRRGSSRQRQQ